MKKIFTILFPAALVAFAAVSCKVEEFRGNEPEGFQTVRIHADIVKPVTKTAVTPNADATEFESQWVEGDLIQFSYAAPDGTEGTTTAKWEDGAFTATLPSGNGDWIYSNIIYPAPSEDGTIDFGGKRTQNGNCFNGAYDIMTVASADEPVFEGADAGCDENGNPVVFPMTRQTAVLYYHLTCPAMAGKKVTGATLTVDGDPIASRSVTYANGVLTPDVEGTNGIKTITVKFDGDTDASDVEVWFNVLPCIYDSVTLTLSADDNSKVTISKKAEGLYEAGYLYKVVKNVAWTAPSVAPSFTVEFKCTAHQGKADETTPAATVATSGAEYLTTYPFMNGSYDFYGVYEDDGTTVEPLRLGTSSKNGHVAINIAEAYKGTVSKVAVTARQYNSSRSFELGVKVNEVSASAQIPGSNNTILEYEFENAYLDSLVFNTNGYIYIESVSVNTVTPALSKPVITSASQNSDAKSIDISWSSIDENAEKLIVYINDTPYAEFEKGSIPSSTNIEFRASGTVRVKIEVKAEGYISAVSEVASVECTEVITDNFVRTTTFDGEGEYLVVGEKSSKLYAMAILSGKTYGYLPGNAVEESETNIIEGNATNCNYAWTVSQTTSGNYTICGIDGNYLYQTGNYNSFNLTTDSTKEGAEWTISANDDGTFSITNVSVSKSIQYTSYGTYGSYSSAQSGGAYPRLYKKQSTSVVRTDPTISAEPLTLVYGKAAQKISVTSDSPATLTYTSKNTDIATVAADGTVTAVKPGTAIIEIKQAASTSYNAGSAEVTVTVQKGDNPAEFAAFQVDIYDYSGLFTKDCALGVKGEKFTGQSLEGATNYRSSNESFIKVNSTTGALEKQGDIGSAQTEDVKISATLPETDYFTEKTVNYNITIHFVKVETSATPSSYSFGRNGGSYDFKLYYLNYRSASVKSVVFSNCIEGISYSADGDILTITCPANTGDAWNGTATVTVTGTTVGNLLNKETTVTLTLSQAAGNIARATYTLEFNSDTMESVSGYSNEWTATSGDFKLSMYNWNNNGNTWSQVRTGSKSKDMTASITTAGIIPEAIEHFIVSYNSINLDYVNSVKLYVCADKSFDNCQTIDAKPASNSPGDVDITITTPTANMYYQLEFDLAKGEGNGFVWVNKITLTNE